jgi:phosphate transport system substrate-binding protein
VAGTLASVTDKSYPLARFVYIAINKAPGQPLPPGVREFLRLVLSREGQEVIAAEGYFLPLPASIVREELAKLD